MEGGAGQEAGGSWLVSVGEWVLCVASVAYFLEGHCGCLGFCKPAALPLVFLFASQIEDYESSESSRSSGNFLQRTSMRNGMELNGNGTETDCGRVESRVQCSQRISQLEWN